MNQGYQRLPPSGGDAESNTSFISTGSGRREVSIGAGDCGHSRNFLFLDMIWNLAFVAVSIFVLLATVRERPAAPLRLWVFGYALQCFLHVGFVWDEYRRRGLDDDDHGNGGGGGNFHPMRVSIFSAINNASMIKKLESVNTIVSSVWWVFGVYWVVIGGQPLLQDSPRLCRLSVVFLAFDLFFVIFCIAMACIVSLLLFFCLPIFNTFTYAMTVKCGASEPDIESLPKYIYRHKSTIESLLIDPEDSECCICLDEYVDGAELCTLPCNHHFHRKCVARWLRVNATCPLCKLSILRGDVLV